MTQTKTQGTELEAKTDFKGRHIDLEGYIFDLKPRASYKFARTIKEMEQYLGENYSNIYQPAIMTSTTSMFNNPYMPTITPDTGVYCPKTST